jgi:CRISPR-associated endonuclease Cas1
MLNYAYGMLVSELRAEIVSSGLDPSIGFMHGNSQNRIPLVYDLMEPLRPVADGRVMQFALDQTFSAGDFSINRFGGCRLNPQLARALAKNITLRDEARRAPRAFLANLGVVARKLDVSVPPV